MRDRREPDGAEGDVGVTTSGTRAPTMTWRVLAVLAAVTALAPLSMDVYTPSLPDIQAELGGGDWLAQASITACLLGIGVGQLAWGPLSDRVGRRPVILVGVAGWTFASVVSAVATTSAMLVGARGIAGLSGAAGIVAARSVVRDLSHESRTVAARIGVLSLVTALAPILAPVAGTGIAALWGWRGDFVAIAVLGAVILVAFATGVPESLPGVAPDEPPRRGLGHALRDRELRWVAVAIGVQAFGFYAYVSTTSFVVERELGYPPPVFALVFGTNALVMFGANLVFRRVVRRRHPSFPLGVGLAVSTAGGVAMLAAAHAHAPVGVLWLTSTAVAASAGFILPGAHSWGQLTLVVSGAASALTGAAQFLGGVLGSPVTGLVGPTAAHLGAVVAVGSGLGLLAWVAARRHRTQDDPG